MLSPTIKKDYVVKPTSNHPSVKLRRLRINLIFNQQKHHSSTFIGTNCSFTYLHKTIVKIHLQKTKNNVLIGFVLSLHHLSNHHLRCRAFSVTKRNYKNKTKLGYASECRKFS